MTTGGKITVVSANEYSNFEVRFSRNTEITNYTQRKMGEKGDIRAEIKNGKSGYAERIYSNGAKSERLGTLDLNTKRYAIFDALRSLDGNSTDVSDKDLAKAKSLIGSLGVKDVQQDVAAGITTIICDDGAVLRFDVETDKEKQVSLSQETLKKAMYKQEEVAMQAKKQREATEFHENCKSDLQKFAEWFMGLFK